MRARTGQFAAECLRCQFAPVAPLRSALHSKGSFVTRGLYYFGRSGFDSDVLQVYPMCNYYFRFVAALRFCLAGGVPPLSIRAGRSTPFRSALIPNIHYSRYLLF